jgi:asparagine synthase (glutamine-hydrolysing)
MCGIVGYLDLRNAGDVAQHSLCAMADALVHRGPDAHGLWVEPDGGGFALAHRRLSIIDTSDAGAQPMQSASGRYIIVFNGEVYNFQTLSAELEGQGCSFKGHSDTEVLLAAFERWGIEDTLKRIAGMFALALYDVKTRELTLARDRLGKKPLYFGWSGDGAAFAFASELKAFKAAQAFKRPDVHQGAVRLYLQWRYVPDPYTIYQNIWKLPPSHYVTLPLEAYAQPFKPQEHMRCYWDFDAVVHQERPDVSEDAALDRLEVALEQAVQERMISDVPLGAFLSGGVDSALIVALMQKHSDQAVSSFTIAFDDPRYNEAEQAAEIAARLGTNHTEMILKPQEALDTVSHLGSIFDEPFADPSAIPTYHVCRLARKDITVALTGDGGDESFAGYSWYARAQKMQKILGLPLGVRSLGAKAFENAVFFDGHFSVAQRQKIAALLRVKNADEIYPLLHSYWSAVTGQPYDASYSVSYDDLAQNIEAQHIVERMMAFDVRMFLAGDVLTKVDRCSMAHSLELRSPLLDHRVVECAWSLPHSLKMRGGTQKYALKQLLRRYLPDDLIDRPKQGFSIPHGQWLRDDLREWAEDMLSVDALKKHNLIAPESVRPYWDAHVSGQADYGHYLWTIVSMQNWAEAWR